MSHFLRLIRWKNLMMIALTQALIKYGLFLPLNVETSLNNFEFTLLVLATLCIAAAGNIINDVYDVETDTINKPDKVIVGKQISEATAFNLFIGLSIVGVGIGFYLSNHIGRTGFSAVFILTSALLYIYSTALKQTVLIGNIVVSTLVALSLIIVGLFELLPAIIPENQPVQLSAFIIVLAYALFAFTINLIREMIKDIEDMKGDAASGLKTFPVLIGIKHTKTVIIVLVLATLSAVVYYVINFLYQHQLAVLYVLVAIVGPLMYFIVKILSAKSNKNFHNLSAVLKLVMLTGILSIALYPLTVC